VSVALGGCVHVQRQRSKTDLAEMVEGGDGADAPVVDALGSSSSERRMSLTRSDVLQLVYPDRHHQQDVVDHKAGLGSDERGGEGSDVGEEVMDAVARELGPKVNAMRGCLLRS
jgi:hypothetical protein